MHLTYSKKAMKFFHYKMYAWVLEKVLGFERMQCMDVANVEEAADFLID